MRVLVQNVVERIEREKEQQQQRETRESEPRKCVQT